VRLRSVQRAAKLIPSNPKYEATYSHQGSRGRRFSATRNRTVARMIGPTTARFAKPPHIPCLRIYNAQTFLGIGNRFPSDVRMGGVDWFHCGEAAGGTEPHRIASGEQFASDASEVVDIWMMSGGLRSYLPVNK
jgi:hypothetical protein